jgi:cold shock CspA family protein
MKGFVNRFDRQRGFGFITSAEGEEIFFHLKDCKKTIFSVEFEVEETEKGLKAVKVEKPKKKDE